MKLEPIIISLLDTDLYKFNMNQVIFHKHTDLNGEYFFKKPQPERGLHARDALGDQ